MTQVAPNPLHEHLGSKCPQCQTVFFGQVASCPQCDRATEPARWYDRFCVERLAFIGTVAVLAGVGALLAGQDGGTAVATLLVSGFLAFSLYLAANYLLGIGGFQERFVEGAVPERARSGFSWGRYLTEIFRMIGVAVALLLLAAACMLVRWALAS
jgi:hypothetical protein